jgi:hypothetical protein
MLAWDCQTVRIVPPEGAFGLFVHSACRGMAQLTEPN